MAGNWIKVRWNLSRDARVLAMAEHVGLPDSDLSARAVSFMLVEVWGLVMEQGERDGDDAILMHANTATLDRVIDTPKFGEAMAQVGWVSSTTFDGKRCLRFPNLLRDNKLVKEQRRDNAERQRKYREKGRDDISDRNALRGVTSNGADKSREDKTNTPPTPQGAKAGGGDSPSLQEIQKAWPSMPTPTAREVADLGLSANELNELDQAADAIKPPLRDKSAWLLVNARKYAERKRKRKPPPVHGGGGAGPVADRTVASASGGEA
jgi:hypothetical protein